jgi:predicted DNA binding CopG/RHH family protein
VGKISVLIRAPLLERVKVIAEDEGMPVQELVDHILRSFTDEYDFDVEDDEDSDQDLSDEDIESEGQDAKT